MTDYSTATGTWELDPSHTTLGFVARHAMLTKVRGKFNEFSGTIDIDGANPSGSTTSVTVSAASFTTENEQRDGHVKSPDFLDVENFPNLTFTSTSIKETGANSFVLAGDLTVKDVTRPVELEVLFTGVGGDPWGGTRVGFEASTEISRKDFGLTWNMPLDTGGVLVSDKIRLELDVQAVKKAE